MLLTKSVPAGLDVPIQRLQTKLHTRLLQQWGIDESKYEAFGRCYRNAMDKGYTAEVFTGGTNYKEVYLNDRIFATSFFGVTDNIETEVKNQVKIHLVFFVNLNKLNLKDREGNDITHRADEEVRNQVQQIIGNSSFGMTMESFELGVVNCLKEYPGTRRDERLKYADFHPWHCFRINLNLFFNPQNC